MALRTWEEAGVTPRGDAGARELHRRRLHLRRRAAAATTRSSSAPGAAATIAPADLDAQAATDRARRRSSSPSSSSRSPRRVRGLEIARAAGVTTILNPAPGRDPARRPPRALRLRHPERDRGRGADRPAGRQPRRGAGARPTALIARGAGAAVITLGARGRAAPRRTAARSSCRRCGVGPVVETTGAGDAFNGGFATGLARGLDPAAAVRLGCAVAGISVTRAGTAPSMPTPAEVEALLSALSGCAWPARALASADAGGEAGDAEAQAGAGGPRFRRSGSGRCPSPASTARRRRRCRTRRSRRCSTSAWTTSTPRTSTAWACRRR